MININWLLYWVFGIIFYLMNIRYCGDILRISKTHRTEKWKLRSDEKVFMWTFTFGILFFLPVAIVMDAIKFLLGKAIGLIIRILVAIRNKLNKIRNK